MLVASLWAIQFLKELELNFQRHCDKILLQAGSHLVCNTFHCTASILTFHPMMWPPHEWDVVHCDLPRANILLNLGLNCIFKRSSSSMREKEDEDEDQPEHIHPHSHPGGLTGRQILPILGINREKSRRPYALELFEQPSVKYFESKFCRQSMHIYKTTRQLRAFMDRSTRWHHDLCLDKQSSSETVLPKENLNETNH